MAVIAVVVTLYALGAAFSALFTRLVCQECTGEFIPWSGSTRSWSGRQRLFWGLSVLCSLGAAAWAHHLIGLLPAYLIALACDVGPLTVGQAVHNHRVRRSRAVSAGRR